MFFIVVLIDLERHNLKNFFGGLGWF